MKTIRLVLPSPEILVGIAEAASAVGLTEIQFIISPEDGLVLNKLDSAKAAHLRVEIPPSAFKEFDVPQKRDVCIDMDGLAILTARIKRLKKQEIEIVIEDNEFRVSNMGQPKREFTVILLTPEEEAKELNLELTTLVVVDAEEMHQQVKDLIGLAEHAIVEVRDGLLDVSGEGDKGKVTVQTTLTELGLVKKHEGPNAKAMYAIGYLSEAFKFLKEFDVVAMRFADNKPLTLTTVIGEGAIRMLIAPKVEQN